MFPYHSLKFLKQSCPSKADGRTWEAELNYRQDCKHIILRTGEELKLPLPTQHRAVVLLHRYFSRDSSVKCTGLNKWAVAVACLFLATKIDSSYHRLESVVHAAYVQLKHFQNKPFDNEYFYTAPDRASQQPVRMPGNPAFLAQLSARVRDAEMDLIFIINFDFNIEVPSTMAIYELRELGLTEAVAATDERVRAVRELAVKTASLSTVSPKSVVCLVHPARHVALAAISWACSCHGFSLDLSKADGCGYTPVMTPDQLAAVIKLLSKPQVAGSRQTTPNPDGATGGAAAAALNSSAAAGAGGSSHGSGNATTTAVKGPTEQLGFPHSRGPNSQKQLKPGSPEAAAPFAGDGSACETATAGPRIDPSPISPDSETGPDTAVGRTSAGTSSGKTAPMQQQQQQQQQQQHQHTGKPLDQQQQHVPSGKRPREEAAYVMGAKRAREQGVAVV